MYNKETFIDNARHATTLDALNNIFETCIAHMGFHKWAYQRTGTGEKPFIQTNYDTRWKNHYLSNDYYFIDPLINQTIDAIHPYQWSSVLDKIALKIYGVKSKQITIEHQQN